MKKSNSKILSDRTDRLLSIGVRYGEGLKAGKNTCITCGKRIPVQKIHSGHWIRRGVYSTRWDSHNVHPQCAGCNTYCDGEPIIYRQKLVKMYGEKIVKDLENKYTQYRRGKFKKNIAFIKENYNYWLKEVRKIEKKLDVKLIPTAWEEE